MLATRPIRATSGVFRRPVGLPGNSFSPRGVPVRNFSNFVEASGEMVDWLRRSRHNKGKINGHPLTETLLVHDHLNEADIHESNQNRLENIQRAFTNPESLIQIAESLAQDKALSVESPGGQATSSLGDQGEIGHEIIAHFPPASLDEERIKLIQELGTNNFIRVFFRSILPTFAEVPPDFWDNYNKTIENSLFRSYFSSSDWLEYFKLNLNIRREVQELNLSNILQNNPLSPWLLGPNPVAPVDKIEIDNGRYMVIGITMVTGPRHVFAGLAMHRFIIDRDTGQLHQFQVGLGTNRLRILDVANNAMFMHMWGVGRAKLLSVLNNPDELLKAGLMVIPPLPIETQGGNRDLHRRIRQGMDNREVVAEYLIRIMNGFSGIPAGFKNLINLTSKAPDVGPVITGSGRQTYERVLGLLSQIPKSDDPETQRILTEGLEIMSTQFDLANGRPPAWLLDFHDRLSAVEWDDSSNLDPEDRANLQEFQLTQAINADAVTRAAIQNSGEGIPNTQRGAEDGQLIDQNSGESPRLVSPQSGQSGGRGDAPTFEQGEGSRETSQSGQPRQPILQNRSSSQKPSLDRNKVDTDRSKLEKSQIGRNKSSRKRA